MQKQQVEKALAGGVVLLLVLLSFNAFTVFSLESKVSEKINLAKEATRPAELELTVIEADCEECFSLELLLKALKEDASIKIIKEDKIQAASDQAKALAQQYTLKKFPAIILRGELERASLGENFEVGEDVAVLKDIQPPYVDSSSMEVKGRVKSIILKEESCEKCTDLDLVVANFKRSQMAITEENTVLANSDEGKALVEKHKVTRLPALLLSEDVLEYTAFAQGIAQLQLEKVDGFYALDELSMPYVDVATGKVTGLVELTLLTDSSCVACYDVNIHKQVLARFGIALGEEKTLDASSAEGKAIISKYKVTKVPTVVLTGDPDAYDSLTKVWAQVGTIEEDGTYIFREINALGPELTYTNLETGKQETTA
ncbi:hypothetical protein HY501_00590 [Candidatus Woesearchaeota archaeon]|nr:hypothetical protein [Candidatus Woesearchaeota archaeon]